MPDQTIPALADHPPYVAVLADVNRLQAEDARLSREIDDLWQRADDTRARRRADAEAVLAGKPMPADEGELHARRLSELRRRRTAVQNALPVARQRLAAARHEARRTPAVADFEKRVWTPAVRKAAVAWVELVKAAAALGEVQEAICREDLAAGEFFTYPLPAFLWGKPDDESSYASFILGELVGAGIIDPKADKALLAGCKPVIPPPPAPPTPPPPKAKKEESNFVKSLRKVGVAIPR